MRFVSVQDSDSTGHDISLRLRGDDQGDYEMTVTPDYPRTRRYRACLRG